MFPSSPKLSLLLKGLGGYVCAFLLVTICDVGGAVRTWNGGGASTNLNVSSNWGGISPVASDSWVFGSTNTQGLLLLNNNLAANLIVGGIAFNSGAPAYTINGNALTLGGDILNNSSSGVTFGTALVLNGNRTISNSSAGSIVLNRVVSGAYSLALGGGTISLLASNSYTKGTTLGGGVTLVLGTNTSAGTGTITASNGVIINLLTGAFPTNALVISGTNSSLTLKTESTSSGSAGFAGPFSGSADQTIVIGGTNQVNLSASSTNQLQAFAGTVLIGPTAGLTFRAGSLANGGSNALFQVDGLMTTRNGGSLSLGALAGAGTLTVGTSNTNNTLTYSIGSKGSNTTFSGSIIDGSTNNNVVAVVKTGAGTQTLTGTNSYSGGTSISSGALAFPSNSNLGSGTITLNGGTLRYTGSEGFGGSFGNSNTVWTNVIASTGGGTLSTASGATWQIGSNVLSGSGSIGLSGGLFVIYGTNSHTGNLIVTGNILELAVANALSSSNISVNSGGELAIDATTTNAITLNGGTLSPNNAAQTSSGAITLGANGGTIALRNWWSTGTVQTLYLNGVVSGSGSLSVTSGGTLSIGNNNSYSGGTVISGGSTVKTTRGSAFGSGTVTLSGGTINGGATFGNAFVVTAGTTNTVFSDTATSSSINLSGPISGSGTFFLNQGSGSHIAYLSGDNSGMTGTMQVGLTQGGNSSRVYLNSYLAGSSSALWLPGNLGLNASNTLQTPYQFGALSGASNLFNNTAGSVFIEVGGRNGSSTYSGVINEFGGGTLTLTKVGTGTQTLAGANIYTGQTILSNGVLSLGIAETAGISGPMGKNTNARAIVFNGGTLQYSSANSYDYSSRFSQDPGQQYSVDNNGQNITWSTALTSPGGSLSKTGAGTLTLAASNSFTGSTTINAGSILLSSSNSLFGSAVILNTANALRFNNGISVFNLDGISGSGVLGLTNNTASTGIQLILSPDVGESLNYAGTLGGAGSLTVSGSGTQILSGVNLQTGGTMVTSGTLALGIGGTLAATNAPITVAGGSINLGGQSVTNSSLVVTSGSIGNGTMTAGSYSISSGMVAAVLAGSASLTQSGSGTTVLSGANIYTGTTTLSSGVLNVAGTESAGFSGPLGRNTNSGAILFNGGTLQYSSSNQFDYSSRFSTATGQRYSVHNNGQNIIWATPLTSFAGSLTKSGDGTLTLSATNTYTGTTTLSGGALLISGTTTASTINTASGTVLRISGSAGSVNASGTIGGTGSAGAVNLNQGSTLNTGSGTAPATFRVSSLLVNGGSTYGWNLFGVTNDLVSSSGSVTFSNTVSAPLNILIATNAATVWNQAVSTNFTILTAANLLNFNPSAVNVIGIGSGLWSLNSTGTSLTLVYTVAGSVIEVTAPSGGAVYQLASAGYSFAGASSPLLKTGGGEYVLNLSNSYGGNTTIASGTLTAATNSAFGASQTIFLGTSTNSGSNAVINISSSGVIVTNTVSVIGAGSNVIANSSGGGVAFRGIVSLSTNATISNLSSNGGSTVLGGSVIGNGALTIDAGSGTVVLSGNNSFSGGTFHSGGVLVISNNSALGTGILRLPGSYAVRAATSLSLTNSVSVSTGAKALLDPAGFGFTLAGPIGGGGDLTVTNSSGSGTVTLSGTNTYAGATTVQTGTLALGSSLALPSTTDLTVGGNGTLNLAGFRASVATLRDGGIGALITNSGGAATLTVNGSDSSSFAGRIAGGTGITMAGTGTLSLAGSNNYTGMTTLSSGVVSLANANAFGSGTIVFGGGYLQYAIPSVKDYSGQFSTNPSQFYNVDLSGMNIAWGSSLKSISGVLNLDDSTGGGTLTLSGSNSYGGGTILSGGALRFSSNTNLGSGSVTLDGGTLVYGGANGTVLTNNRVLLVGSNGGAVRIANGTSSVTQFWLNTANALQGTGTLSIAGAGSPWSNFRISQTNTYFTGDLNVTGASLEYGILNAVSPFSSIVVGNSGELVANVNIPNALTLDGGSLSPNNSSTLSYAGPITLTSNGGSISLRQWWDGSARSFAIGGGIYGDGGLIVAAPGGASTLTLAGYNSYAGGTVITNSSTLLLSGDEVLPSIGTVSLANSAKLDLGGNSQSLGGLAGSGSVINSTGYLALNVADAVSTSFDGVISGGGMLFTAGIGTQTLSGKNSYSGGTVLAGGTLQLTNGGTLGDVTQMIVVDGSILDLGGGTLTSGDYSHYSGTLTNGTLIASNYNMGSGVIGAVLSGGAGLSQNGGGITVLSSSNDYFGETVINSGILQVDGSLIGNGTVTVNAGGTLAGLGSLGNVTVNDGGYLSPSAGGSLSVLTAASLVLSNAANTTLQVNAPGVAGTGYDQIAINGGSLTYGGDMVLVNDSLNDSLTNTFAIQLFKGYGAQSGDFNSVTLNGYILGTGSSLSNNAGIWSWSDPNTGVTYSFNKATGAFIGWNPVAPEWIVGTGSMNQLGLTNGSALVFDGYLSGTVTNSTASSLSGISYEETLLGSYSLVGNSITIGSGGIVNKSTNAQSIALNLTLGADQTFLADAGPLNVTGSIANAGFTSTLDGSSGTSLSGVLSGAGGLTKVGSGTAILAGGNSYSGLTTISSGTLQVGNGGTTGSLGSGTIVNNAAISFNRSDFARVSNAISGSGTVIKSGLGKTALTANNSYSGGTVINEGILQVGDGSTTGSLGSGAVTVNASLAFSRSDTISVANQISGTGGVIQSGAGTLILTSANSYTGPTLISSGALSLANTGSLSGSTSIEVSSGSTLLLGAANQVNTNAALTLAGGTLSLAASSTRASANSFATLTLTANSTIDFGNLAGASSLTFSAINGLSNYKLTVFDWNGTGLAGVTSTTGGVNQFTRLFDTSSLTADQLANISFYSGSSTSSGFLGYGGFVGSEIVPVPEPGVWAVGLMLLVYLVFRGSIPMGVSRTIEQFRRKRF